MSIQPAVIYTDEQDENHGTHEHEIGASLIQIAHEHLSAPPAHHPTVLEPRLEQRVLRIQQVDSRAHSRQQYRSPPYDREHTRNGAAHQAPGAKGSYTNAEKDRATQTLPGPVGDRSPHNAPEIADDSALAPYIVVPGWIIYRIGTDTERKENRTHEQEKTTYLADSLHVNGPVHQFPPL
jgi:hypothetical protein